MGARAGDTPSQPTHAHTHVHTHTSAAWLNDGYCDLPCNTTACAFDDGDCLNATALAGIGHDGLPWGKPHAWAAGVVEGVAPPNVAPWEYGRGGDQNAVYGALVEYCAAGCESEWVGDKHCDRACVNAACGFDGGDCGASYLTQFAPGHTLEEGEDQVHAV